MPQLRLLVRVLVLLQGKWLRLRAATMALRPFCGMVDKITGLPVPDEVALPTIAAMQKLVAEQIGKMSRRASLGFDCVAAPFIKYATVLRPRMSGRGTERVNVLEPFIGQLFTLLYEANYN
eukprot:196676-Pelagomonas_calceolata.AAC.1